MAKDIEITVTGPYDFAAGYNQGANKSSDSDGRNSAKYSLGGYPNATWYSYGYFTSAHVAWKVHNNSDKPLKVSKVVIYATPCNLSAHGTYCTAYPSGRVYPKGYGCTFRSDIFPLDGSASAESREYKLLNLNADNVYAWAPDSPGNTGFGKSKEMQSNGLIDKVVDGQHTTMWPRELEFDNPATIPAKGDAYVHVRVTQWNEGTSGYAGGSANCVLACIFSTSYFSIDVATEPRKFLWQWVDHKYEDEGDDVPEGKHWRKIIDVYQKNSSGWENIGEKHYKSNQE